MKIKNWDAKLVGAWVYFLANNNHNLEHFLKALLEPFIENFRYTVYSHKTESIYTTNRTIKLDL